MPATSLHTKNLDLVPKSAEEVRAAIAAMDPATKAELSADWLALLAAVTSADVWVLGYSVVHRASGAVVGSCGYKGPPTADGAVEIAYGIDSEQRSKGYATEAAAALVDHAFATAEVRVVIAHTLPDSHASQKVLANCGFAHVGEVIDPDDGRVFRYEKRRGP